MRHDLGRSPAASKWESRLADLAPDAVCLLLVPKPHDGPNGPLHRVLLGTGDGKNAWIEGLTAEPDGDVIAQAYTDKSDRQTIEDFAFSRSHSPGAGLDHGKNSGKGFGFTLYSTLALHVASDPDRQRAGVFSPEAGASSSADEDALPLGHRPRGCAPRRCCRAAAAAAPAPLGELPGRGLEVGRARLLI